MTPDNIRDFILLGIDFIVVYVVVYYLLKWSIQTRSFTMVKGLFVVFSVYFLSMMLELPTITWILNGFFIPFVLVLVVVFQNEIRRFLDQLGRPDRLFKSLPIAESRRTKIIGSFLKAMSLLSSEKIGALIVIEQSTHLGDYVETGIFIDSEISSDLITTLFWEGTPTHDGAIIIRGDRIVSAGCLLPLTDTPLSDRRLGTRHRAAMGLSEVTDAVVFVVSEEQGVISIAEHGELNRHQTKESLEERLLQIYDDESVQSNINAEVDSSVLGKAG
jgi:diadenylate cyclase